MADYMQEYTETERNLLAVMRLNPRATWREIGMALGMNQRRAMALWHRIKTRRPAISPRELLKAM